MNRLSFYTITSLIFLSLIFFTYKIFNVKHKDLVEYHNILHRKTKLSSCEKLKRKPLKQFREEVQKDIYQGGIKDQDRLHFRIFAKNSSLYIRESQKNLELIDDMEDIKCLAQDRIYQKDKDFHQQIRYFTAKKGKYRYPSNIFLTDSINITMFNLPGKVIPDNIDSYTPYLTGFAKEVSFSIKNGFSSINANHLRASFEVNEKIK